MRKSGHRSASHQQFKEKAKTRVDDLQGMFTDLQSARMESRAGDVAVLEEQVHQMLREWKAELNQASPATSLHGNSHSSDLSSDIRRLLQLTEEQDDATSKLAELPPMSPKMEPLNTPSHGVGGMHAGKEVASYQEGNSHSSADLSLDIHRLLQHYEEEDLTTKLADLLPTNLKPGSLDVLDSGVKCAQSGGNAFQEDYYLNQEVPEHGFFSGGQYQNTISVESHHVNLNCLEENNHLDFQQFNLHQQLPSNQYLGCDTSGQHGANGMPHLSELLPTMCPPASAFLRPKCALWDCPRPAQGSEWCADYCSRFHSEVALNEGPPGMTPVVRPGGIDLKDGPLFAALTAKTQGKLVGIPECEGAATKKSPWNASDIFDLSVLEGETLREWLFFDKPRRAFENGNRKQRSLQDYNGRGWHESRKQVMKEFGGLKRSYYMDPQPSEYLEWHMYEYEITNCNVCALYRLELKLVDSKKGIKAKVTGDSLIDLQQQMGRLNAESSGEIKRKGRAKASPKENKKNTSSDLFHEKGDEQIACHASNQMAHVNDNHIFGSNLSYVYPDPFDV